ncbi:trigger factor [Anaerolineales bacterium]
MDLQTERLENHSMRMTVDIDMDQLESAKRKAAKELSKKVNIPGFRKGKVPYNIVLRYFGEAGILEDAIEILGNDLYKQALDESGVDPYGPGSLDDVQLEGEPKLVFSVPLVPEVTLSDFRAIREEIEIPEITDKEVDDELQALLRREALVEESTTEAKLGDRVSVDIHSEFADGEEAPDTEDEDEDEEMADESPYKGEGFLHRHDLSVDLVEENTVILPGFAEALVGANVGDDLEFELEVPDEEDFEEIVGRKIKFNVHVKKIENVILPKLDDEFAAQMTEGQEKVLTLLELRTEIRKDLEEAAKSKAESEYADAFIQKVVEASEIRYPEMMIEERIDALIQELDNNLRQQNIDLETYKKLVNVSDEELRERYVEAAERQIRQSLVVQELMSATDVEVQAADIDARIDKMLAQFGEGKDQYRAIFDTPQMRSGLASEMIYKKLQDHLVAIGTGQEIETVSEVADEVASEIAETDDADSSEADEAEATE